MDKLKELFDSAMAGTLTQEEKAFVRSRAKPVGVEVKQTRCKSCWADIISSILNAEKQVSGKASPYQLREPYASTGIRWNDRFVSQALMNKGLYKEMIAAGLGHLFEKSNEDRPEETAI